MDFGDKVAVVTGAASGIGFGLAQHAASLCGRVVVADIREQPLAEAADLLRATGAEVLAVPTDVTSPAAIERLADAAVARFGKINLVFNNAGIFQPGVTWELSLEAYDRIIDVNLKSVINGIRTFVPRMIRQGDECHVINTASAAGLVVMPGFGSYSMTKHGVLALSEGLWLDLDAAGIATVGVTVVLPGAIQSNIMQHEQPATAEENSADLSALKKHVSDSIAVGMPAAMLAELVFAAIEKGSLYVLPNFADESNLGVARAIANGRFSQQNPFPAINAAIRES